MKLKDYVTMGNLLSGYASVIALFHGSFEWACYLIFIGYAFDVLDGPVARLTKQHDRFGGIFDSVCDFITNSIAPGFILYYAFWKIAGFPWWVAAIIGAFPVCFGTIRQAKQQERPLSYPGYFLGMPRPVLAIFIIALLNSSMFTISVSPWREVGYGVTILLTVLGSIMHLSFFPFISHHGRRWMGSIRFGQIFFLLGSPAALLWGWLLFDAPAIVFDWVLGSLLVYIFIAWMENPKEDYRRIRHYVETGELIEPLIGLDSDWHPGGMGAYFRDKTETAVPSRASTP